MWFIIFSCGGRFYYRRFCFFCKSDLLLFQPQHTVTFRNSQACLLFVIVQVWQGGRLLFIAASMESTKARSYFVCVVLFKLKSGSIWCAVSFQVQQVVACWLQIVLVTRTASFLSNCNKLLQNKSSFQFATCSLQWFYNIGVDSQSSVHLFFKFGFLLLVGLTFNEFPNIVKP